jgi:hypothetical protein
MATRNHSRGTRHSGRSGGNRPRTHPTTPKPSARGSRTPTKLTARDMQERLMRRPPTKLPPGLTVEMLRDARDARPRLKGTEVTAAVRRLLNIHAVITTAGLALRQQNAEHDRDISITLIRAVADPMWSALQVLARLVGVDLSDDERSGSQP